MPTFSKGSNHPSIPARLRSPRPTAVGLMLLGALMALGCATGSGLTREQVLGQVETIGALEARLDLAQEHDLQILAPSGVAAARESFDRAMASADDGAPNEAERYAKQGLAQLEQAEKDLQRSSDALREVLVRRQQAIAADAPTLLPERFQALDQQLIKASGMAENGDVKAAKNAAPHC